MDQTSPSEPMTYTFKNGVKVRIRPVSPFTIQAIETSIPKPAPPMQLMEMANGEKSEEPNPLHPSYGQALSERRQQVMQRQSDAMFRLGIDVEVDQRAVAEFREMAEEMGLELDKNDKLVYIKHLLIGSTGEMREVVGLISGMAIPGEEKIAAAADAFKSDAAG